MGPIPRLPVFLPSASLSWSSQGQQSTSYSSGEEDQEFDQEVGEDESADDSPSQSSMPTRTFIKAKRPGKMNTYRTSYNEESDISPSVDSAEQDVVVQSVKFVKNGKDEWVADETAVASARLFKRLKLSKHSHAKPYDRSDYFTKDNKPRQRAKRRNVTDFSVNEVWLCSFEGCLQAYKRTSSISINRHRAICRYRPGADLDTATGAVQEQDVMQTTDDEQLSMSPLPQLKKITEIDASHTLVSLSGVSKKKARELTPRKGSTMANKDKTLSVIPRKSSINAPEQAPLEPKSPPVVTAWMAEPVPEPIKECRPQINYYQVALQVKMHSSQKHITSPTSLFCAPPPMKLDAPMTPVRRHHSASDTRPRRHKSANSLPTLQQTFQATDSSSFKPQSKVDSAAITFGADLSSQSISLPSSPASARSVSHPVSPAGAAPASEAVPGKVPPPLVAPHHTRAHSACTPAQYWASMPPPPSFGFLPPPPMPQFYPQPNFPPQMQPPVVLVYPQNFQAPMQQFMPPFMPPLFPHPPMLISR